MISSQLVGIVLYYLNSLNYFTNRGWQKYSYTIQHSSLLLGDWFQFNAKVAVLWCGLRRWSNKKCTYMNDGWMSQRETYDSRTCKDNMFVLTWNICSTSMELVAMLGSCGCTTGFFWQLLSSSFDFPMPFISMLGLPPPLKRTLISICPAFNMSFSFASFSHSRSSLADRRASSRTQSASSRYLWYDVLLEYDDYRKDMAHSFTHTTIQTLLTLWLQ